MTNWYKTAQNFGDLLEESPDFIFEDMLEELGGKPEDFFVNSLGSTCYDQTGITFPEKHLINWDKITAGANKVWWEGQFGWANQPKVLCFTATRTLAKEIKSRLPENKGLGVKLKWEEGD